MTQKLFRAVLFCTLALCAGSTRTIEYSIDTWKELTGYAGDVCVVEVDSSNRPFCSNGVRYTRASVNAYEGYELWVDCVEYGAPHACQGLDN